MAVPGHAQDPRAAQFSCWQEAFADTWEQM